MAKAIWFYRLDPEWYSCEDVGIASSTLFWDLHWKMAFPSALKMFLLIEIHNSRCPNTSHASGFVFFQSWLIMTSKYLQIFNMFQLFLLVCQIRFPLWHLCPNPTTQGSNPRLEHKKNRLWVTGNFRIPPAIWKDETLANRAVSSSCEHLFIVPDHAKSDSKTGCSIYDMGLYM